MILYVDETENNEYFIVIGLLVWSREEANRVYKSFKKKARSISIPAKDKSKLFTEFKSVLMDRRYQKLKVKMIESIAEIDRISEYSNVQAIMSRDSQQESGIQLVDNMCSIIRLHLSGTDEYDFYSLIKNWVREV